MATDPKRLLPQTTRPDASAAAEGGSSRYWQWPFWVLLALALVLPALLVSAVAWHERNVLLREGEQIARRTSSALTEHALKVLETHALVLEQIDSQIRGRSWDDIAGDQRLQSGLATVVDKFSQVTSIALVDAEGRLRQSSAAERGHGVSVLDRDYFAAHRDGTADRIFISETFQGRIRGVDVFTVSMRRTTDDGSFDGLIIVGVDLDYFTSFWTQFAPSLAYVIPLMRADGMMLVRYPADKPRKLAPTAPFMRQIAANPDGGFYVATSQLDGVERMNAFSRIGDFPLYVSFSLESRALLAPWRERLALSALLGALTMLALIGLVLMAMRQARAQRARAREQQLSAARWQEVAERHAEEIRRRKQAETELLQAQKMEAVGQLTGGVAHDFNNLLHAMGLNLRLAERTVGAAPAATFLAGIGRGIERASKLTQQLTAFSRRQRLEPHAFSPDDLVLRMVELLHRTLGGTIELELDVERDVWPIFADLGQTELALLNLAVNARDAMPDGGKLTIRARNRRLTASLGATRAGDYIELSVTDNGTGMPAAVVEHAFEPFFTTKDVGKGSGLGLSMVHGFATQSGGAVTIDSRVGHGTTVSLLLPRSSEAAVPMVPATRTGQQRSRLGGRILLAEDDSLVRVSMLHALTEAGYRVDEARNGAEALDVLRRDPIDLLVTDYAMPGMNGVELAHLARALLPGLPVVLVTGYAQPTLNARQPDHQVEAVLHKPFDPAELVARIDALLWTPLAAARADSGRVPGTANSAVEQPGPAG
jgi:two-component system, NtrC family, sensor kinase